MEPNKDYDSKKVLIILISIIVILLIVASYLIVWVINNNEKPLNLQNQTGFKENFRVIVLPDTQMYSEKYPEIFMNQTKWIAENKNKLNIKMVIHEGDIVNIWNNLNQWDNANKSLSILDENEIPYSVIPGNHDSKSKANYTHYNMFFPVSRYSNKPWYGGSFDNYKNNYELLNISKENYIFISLNICPDDSEIAWANLILSKYPDYKAILTTHAYLSKDDPPKRETSLCNTEYIWDELIKNNKNLRIVLCGHSHSERRRSDANDNGRAVYQILSDYQELEKGGNGFLRIFEFFPSENKIDVKTYSPYLDKYKTDENSEFVIYF